MNNEIRSSQVRLISDSGEQLGILSLQEALKHARSKELDLVEVAPEAVPPVCKLMDFGKHLYQIKKRIKESKKKQHVIHVKEVVFRPQIDDHDFNVKKKRTIKFLEEGNRVKITIRFRGREMRRQELGQKVIDRLLSEVADYGVVEGDPVFSERNINVVLTPKRKD
ncbi:MAG TPA: translation initiation factor IF-3 [Thermoanaerobaculia bacterium]|nr:translation initiation factor IF-3 [Thermoanaerobaculia bacterium]HUM30689.1 translation initiation factor IF-3 [Thermoanaerobaculia bacterium]HXK68903.1 translation initiation factor IF-3 [Thermoanaerobaculia bacterium]